MSKYLLAVSLSVIFFLIEFWTLSDYGVSWDETLHFRRGQAYLHYFLTGKTDYQDLLSINLQGTEGKPENIPSPRRSFYQNDYHNGIFWLKNDSGHPPLNDLLAAFSNYVFFQKLGLLDDISAHHLFNIFTASLLVFIVTYFMSSTFGKFAALISFLSLTTYPLFWSESHFNIKDPPEAAFFAGTIWAFFESLKKGNLLWLLLSIVFFTLGLGTKFNIVFLPAIVIPYLAIRYSNQIKNLGHCFQKIPKLYFLTLVAGPCIALAIVVFFWPFLKQDFLLNLPKILSFYHHIGVGTSYQPISFYILGFNTFPIKWIIFTTSPIVLLLLGIGIYSSIKHWSLKNSVVILWLLWLLIPILRVSLPNMSIYGGIRQVMEFVPAMVLLAGIGAWQIVEWTTRCKNTILPHLTRLFLVLIFIYPVIILIKMHPNENVYFNSLIGGLKGASENNFPSWGNSFGNAYKAGINWINSNAESNAKVALMQGTPANAPLILFRSDLNYDNKYFSGIDRRGEYLMELTFNDTGKANYYKWEYVEKFLNPVYEVKADDVAILKIWKNDLQNTKEGYNFTKVPYLDKIGIEKDKQHIILTLSREILLAEMNIQFNSSVGCMPVSNSFLETSLDGNLWVPEKEPISSDQLIGVNNIFEGNLKFLFVGRRVKFIRVAFLQPEDCIFNNSKIKLEYLK